MHHERCAWDALRATRSTLSGSAGSTPERQAVYASALEQAEQFFRAARMVGPATQPALAFYGLSQAGRATAAAAIALPDKSAAVEDSVDEWKLKGHGIQTLYEDGPLPDVVIKTDVRKKSRTSSPTTGRYRAHLTPCSGRPSSISPRE
ncbi:YaaC family protein [Streptomyces sp. NPDC057699]|uniref:YaaC family protein n=1 Tax=Streptomyces sp. NPDC057699 TaxID=3346220 RepID=UPI0036B98AE7